MSLISIAIICLGIVLADQKKLISLGLLILGCSTFLSLIANRRSNQWRRAHPFKQWLGLRD